MAIASMKNIRQELLRCRIPVSFHKGEGYHYVEFDNGEHGSECLYGTKSIMVPFLNHLTREQWVHEIRQAWDELDAEHEGAFKRYCARFERASRRHLTERRWQEIFDEMSLSELEWQLKVDTTTQLSPNSWLEALENEIEKREKENGNEF